MKIRRSIFTKYFALCILTILASTIILGAILLVLISRSFHEEKRELLLRTVSVLAQVTEDRLDEDVSLHSADMQDAFAAYGRATGVDVFLIRKDGGILLSGTRVEVPRFGHFSETYIGKIDAAPFYEVGNLGGISSEQFYTAAAPVRTEDGAARLFVLALMPYSLRQDYLLQILGMFGASSLIVLVGVSVVVYFVSKGMAKPLREMSEAARQYGAGNFSKRISIPRQEEMGKLAISLNEMAVSLCNLEAMRRSFVANVSHELKTPMTTIAGFIDGILDGTIPREKEKQYLSIVSDEVKRLSRLVRSMLNLSRIESGELTLRKVPVDLVEVVCQTVFTFEQQIEEKHIRIRGLDRAKVMLQCDEDLMHQVIYNLVENAVKFAGEDGYIAFDFRSAGGRTTFRIKNSGEGLTEDELRRVFERFYKTDQSRGLDRDGVGLGLYIVRTIVELHGGEINVDSVYGEYTAFTLTLATGGSLTSLISKKQPPLS